MNYKLEYISKLFQKTSNKAIENYVLNRLWHRLDNEDIKIVPQQYVDRHYKDDLIDVSYKYALTDVYFPQFGIHVEVNEPAHYESESRIYADGVRKFEIESQTGHKVIEVDCRKNLTEIHEKVDIIVRDINKSLMEQKKVGVFKPWQPDLERNPELWKKKNVITLGDDISLNSIEDICNLFRADFNKTKRGYLRKGGILHPQNDQILLWWPAEISRNGWVNKLDDHKQIIIETHSNQHKKYEHFNEHYKSKIVRYVFFHYKDILGSTNYRFKGVYALDNERSNEEVGIVWKRIAERIILDPNSYE